MQIASLSALKKWYTAETLPYDMYKWTGPCGEGLHWSYKMMPWSLLAVVAS